MNQAPLRRIALLASIILIVASCSSDEPSPDLENTTVGFIFVGERDDLGYNQAAWEGSDALARAFPDLTILRKENVPETEGAKTALEDMVSRGATVLFATSFGHLPWAYAVAKEHPDVIVLHQGGVEPDPHVDNLGTYWGTVFEPVYQAGIAAGAATKTNKLGYVVAFPIPATYLNVDAFTLGARSVNPLAETHVVFTQDWCDMAKQRRSVATLLEQGVDVLSFHQDCTEAILERAEAEGVFVVGYHSDGSEVAPNGWLVGSVWNWGPLFVEMMRAIVEGRFAESPYNGDYRGGYKARNNPFVLTEFGAAVETPTRALIAKAGERFADGESPFDGPLKDRDGHKRIPAGAEPSVAELDALDFFVRGVVGDIPK